MRPVAFSREEGGDWSPWADKGPGGTVHAIKFDNGRILDTVNGWRDLRPMTVRQKISLYLFQEHAWLKSAASCDDPKLKAWALSEADWQATKRRKLEVQLEMTS